MHIPVLLDEVVSALRPRAGGQYLDATVGGGGHSEALLKASGPDGRVLGTDADAAAIARTAERLSEFGERVVLRQAWLDEAPALAHSLGFTPLDGALADLGLSSNQLADAERGFAFMRAGPLDMRFDVTRGVSAADLINSADVAMLVQILRDYGEVQHAPQVAEAIWAARPVRTTTDLSEAVTGVARSRGPVRGSVRGSGRSRIHPATQVFQAFRIAVNDELRRLSDALPRLIDALAPGGRLAVITFHSLEDRIVKQTFRAAAYEAEPQPGFGESGAGQAALVRLVTKKPVEPKEAEVAANPRARSARLRVVEKIS